jgi:hypothetical protein
MVNPRSSKAIVSDGASIVADEERRRLSEVLRSAEDAVFNGWEDRPGSFVRDGAMPGYASAERKILFILKEVSGTTEPDLRFASSLDWYQVPGRWRNTWYAAIHWATALRGESVDTDQITPEVWQRSLEPIAVVNVKKTPGGTTADHGEIETFVRQNARFLKKQLSLYKPHLTICGSDFVADCLALLYGWTERDWRGETRGPRGDEIWELDSPVLGRVISFWHPNQRSRKRSETSEILKAIAADWSSGR